MHTAHTHHFSINAGLAELCKYFEVFSLDIVTTVASYLRQMSHLTCKRVGYLLFMPSFFFISNKNKAVGIDIFEICFCGNSGERLICLA